MKKIFLILLLFILGSCWSPKYIEVPVEKVKTVYVNNTSQDSTNKFDSIYIYDSIYIKEKGDTIYSYKEKTKYKIQFKDRIINNSDTVIKIDSIDKPVIVEKEVQVNKIYWWQKCLMYTGLLFLIGLIVKLYNKIKK